MDRKLLEKMLVENKVPSDMYSLQGGLPNEAYCIDKIDGKWEVYYSERGTRSYIGRFDDEEEACNCLIKQIKRNLPGLNFS